MATKRTIDMGLNPDESDKNQFIDQDVRNIRLDDLGTPDPFDPDYDKKVKKVNVEEKFLTTYYEFPGNFTTNLRGSKQFLQITVGVSTQYDEEVMVNVESHQLALRGIILGVMSEYSQDDVAGREGKQALADSIKYALNIFLEDKEGFGGVEGIHFTSFVLQ